MKAKKEMQCLKEKSDKNLWKSSPQHQHKPSADHQLRASTQFKPFSLSSIELHAKAKSVMEEQKKAEELKEQQARKFKARPVAYNKSRTYTDVVSDVDNTIAQHKKFTKPIEPVLQSMQRSQVHKALEEEKKAREAEAASVTAAKQEASEQQEAKDIKVRRPLMLCG
jgi:hypothetical protein